MVADRCECFFREKFGLEITQPKVFAEAVACDCFNATQFTIGLGIVDRSVHEIVDTTQHAAGA